MQEIHKPILARRGYFIAGKFDQFKRNLPFASLIQALQSLVEQLLTESGERLARWRASILAAVGANGGVLLEGVLHNRQISEDEP